MSLLGQPHIPLTDLQKISFPSLVIGGDHDVIREEHTMLNFKNILKACLWILPAPGHSTPMLLRMISIILLTDFFLHLTEQ
jgi:hypothetical protein